MFALSELTITNHKKPSSISAKSSWLQPPDHHQTTITRSSPSISAFVRDPDASQDRKRTKCPSTSWGFLRWWGRS
uniref:Uncharacterized protein n=1 Tax=Malus domestica TaxID=3750 RepID=E4Z8P5_MALDO|nr:hypothetical protein [Malus domestica]